MAVDIFILLLAAALFGVDFDVQLFPRKIVGAEPCHESFTITTFRRCEKTDDDENSSYALLGFSCWTSSRTATNWWRPTSDYQH